MANTANSSVGGSRSWLHPDHLFAKDGINYNVKYIGCLEVFTSMKLLDFDTRSAVAKECIHRVCEVSGSNAQRKRPRKPDGKILRMLASTPLMKGAGLNVQLTITSLHLTLSDLDTGKPILTHDMPNVSFASGGDADTSDYVAYVGKNEHDVRSCYVLECRGGLAQDVITTIGQAFELRFKEFLKRTPPLAKPPPLTFNSCGGSSSSVLHCRYSPNPLPAPPCSSEMLQEHGEEVEYYNDLPGKTPPELSASSKEWATSSNLIDLNTEIPPGHPDYVNGDIISPRIVSSSVKPHVSAVSPPPQSSHRDPFDMSPFETQAPGGGVLGLMGGDDVTTQVSSKQEPEDKIARHQSLLKEDWFHGPISRKDAENLLENDGDFLVRESQGSVGQYVLTGMQSSSKKHLLLVDPRGVVRTKDRTFESVSHLISFHRDNALPIISAESALRLKTPVLKRVSPTLHRRN